MRAPLIGDQGYDFLHAPKLAIDSRSLRWSDPKRLVTTREVVMHEVKRDRCSWFASFLLNAFVSRVNRRMRIHIVRF